MARLELPIAAFAGMELGSEIQSAPVVLVLAVQQVSLLRHWGAGPALDDGNGN